MKSTTRHKISPGSRWCLDLSQAWLFSRHDRRRWLRSRVDREPCTTQIDLPHCWNIGEEFRQGIQYHQGLGSYRKHVDLPAEVCLPGAVWRLEVDGFYGRSQLKWNGRSRPRVDGQYLGLWADVSSDVQPGPNQIDLELDNRWSRKILPGRPDPDFLLYGGLSGGARLWRINPIHFVSREIQVGPQVDPERETTVTLISPISNETNESRTVVVNWKIFDPQGDQVVEGCSAPLLIAPCMRASVESKTVVPDPRLWSLRTPQQYTIHLTLYDDHGTALDHDRVRIGLRQSEFRQAQGFFLNGERVELHGCNRHASLPGFGNALPTELHRYDAQLLRQMGANFVRLAHYPQSSAFLDGCDELGLLVYAEIASWKTMSTGAWLKAALRQATAMVVRDRNRPSIIVWGVSNEARSRPAFAALQKRIHELDPGRPVTYAENHHHRAQKKRLIGLPDIWSINYEVEVLDQARRSNRQENVLLTECMNPYLIESDENDLAIRQLEAMERDWEATRKSPWVAGYAIWCFADYATLHRLRYRRLAGLFNAWRQPKPGVDLFRARHAEDPFVAIHADWGVHMADSRCRIWLISNCQYVELHCENQVVGRLEDMLMTELEVQFRDADLVAIGTRGERTVVERLPAHRDAVVLKVAVSPVEGGPTQVVDLQVDDANGVRVTCWSGTAQVSVKGPVTLRALTPAGEVEITRGRGRCFLTPSLESGSVEVEAQAESLRSGIGCCEV